MWVGVDFGTSNSVVSLWDDVKARAKVVKVKGDRRVLPSVASVSMTTAAIEAVGYDALRISGSWRVASAKRVLGRLFDEEGARSHALHRRCAGFTIARDPAASSARPGEEGFVGDVLMEHPERGSELRVRPFDVAAALLGKLHAIADDYVRRKEKKDGRRQGRRQAGGGAKASEKRIACVLGVPAHFNKLQRDAARSAALEAGFVECVPFVESTAAAMAYGILVAGSRRVLVFDMGGGTTDITLLDCRDGTFEVRAVHGNNELGGDDLDEAFAGYIAETYAAELGAVANDMQRVAEIARDAKVALSLAEVHQVRAPRADAEGGAEVTFTLSRRELEAAIAPLLREAVDLAGTALAQAGGASEDGLEVVLVGGCTRIPLLRRLLQEQFPTVPELCSAVDAETVVAQGCAIRAAICSGVKPEKLRSLLMLDVCPLAIGVGILGGKMAVVIEQNSRLPAEGAVTLQLERAHQEHILVEIFEGNSDLTEQNHPMGWYTFPVKAPEAYLREHEGEPRHITLTFAMDHLGKLTVRCDVEGVDKDAEMDPLQFYFLLAMILLLLCFYAFTRVYLSPIHVDCLDPDTDHELCRPEGAADGGTAPEL